MRAIINFQELEGANLIVDALYKGGDQGGTSDDPLPKLVSCGNQGGFRWRGPASAPRFCVLYSSMEDPAWPDELDLSQGTFTYFGDNKVPGSDLHSKSGNKILRNVFDLLHNRSRSEIPPFFVFTKGGTGRDVIFRGLAVPGVPALDQNSDLVAIWRTKNSRRFQNYKALFSILDTDQISSEWIKDLINSLPASPHSPLAWRKWILGGKYETLTAPKVQLHRSRSEQVPSPQQPILGIIVNTLVEYFKNHQEFEYAFEKCAAELFRLFDKNVISCDLTRRWRDGGRDATGKYRIGTAESHVAVEFALEAKCKILSSGSGVAEVSRLISRLRYRQFGVFVTTSYVGEQAYKEIVDDGHPVIILSAIDIAGILNHLGYNTRQSLEQWLKINFP